MARIRTIKPEFFTSLTIADLTPEQRLTFIGLWTHVDDAGRCVDDARLIKAAVWPLDDRTAAEVEVDLKALSESSLITRYTVNQKRYLAVTNWAEHQRINRPTPSKLPGPDQADQPDPKPPTSGNDDSRTPHGGLTEDSSPERKGKEQGKERRGEGPAGVTPPPASTPPSTPPASRPDGLHPIPDDFHLNDTMRRWVNATYPALDPEWETQQFIAYWRGEGRRKRNWHEAWRKWIADSAKRASERASGKHLHAVPGGWAGSNRPHPATGAAAPMPTADDYKKAKPF